MAIAGYKRRKADISFLYSWNAFIIAFALQKCFYIVIMNLKNDKENEWNEWEKF